MVPFIVFLAVTAVSAAIRLFVVKRPLRSGRDWQRPLAHGMAAMFLIAASGHFIEPLRSGLIATVPPIIPLPDLVVSATGVVEIVFAVALLLPFSRRLAGTAAVLYLLAVFPANVLAATAVDHPDAPSTPLLLRTVIQVVFLAASVVIALKSDGLGARDIVRALRPRKQTAGR
jgi:uncharacterized membrane protein